MIVESHFVLLKERVDDLTNILRMLFGPSIAPIAQE